MKKEQPEASVKDTKNDLPHTQLKVGTFQLAIVLLIHWVSQGIKDLQMQWIYQIWNETKHLNYVYSPRHLFLRRSKETE